jgi:hypothetical protein
MHCVKCGKTPLEVSDFTVTDDRFCPPCCKECQPEVAREARLSPGFWPNDFYGHWLWALGKWHENAASPSIPRKLNEFVQFLMRETARRSPSHMDGEWFTVDELYKQAGYSISGTRAFLDRCVKAGLIERRERFRRGFWYKYEYRVKP